MKKLKKNEQKYYVFDCLAERRYTSRDKIIQMNNIHSANFSIKSAKFLVEISSNRDKLIEDRILLLCLVIHVVTQTLSTHTECLNLSMRKNLIEDGMLLLLDSDPK